WSVIRSLGRSAASASHGPKAAGRCRRGSREGKKPRRGSTPNPRRAAAMLGRGVGKVIAGSAACAVTSCHVDRTITPPIIGPPARAGPPLVLAQPRVLQGDGGLPLEVIEANRLVYRLHDGLQLRRAPALAVVETGRRAPGSPRRAHGSRRSAALYTLIVSPRK